MLQVTRRYAKKFSNEREQRDDVPGYTDFRQVTADLEGIFDVIWISGTRKIFPLNSLRRSLAIPNAKPVSVHSPD